MSDGPSSSGRSGERVLPVSVVVPGLVVRSEMNARGHWTKAHRRKSEQMNSVAAVLALMTCRESRGALAGYPKLVVTLTRLYAGRARAMDTDNLHSAFKFVRDAVAMWLGRDDSPRSGIEWRVGQEHAAEPGVRIEVGEV